MRIIIGAAVATLLLAASPLFVASPASAQDEAIALCNKYLPKGTPCDCVGPILDEEYEDDELEPLLQFLNAFMSGLGGDEKAAQQTIDRLAAKHGKNTIEDWLKRFEALSPETEKTCKFKF